MCFLGFDFVGIVWICKVWEVLGNEGGFLWNIECLLLFFWLIFMLFVCRFFVIGSSEGVILIVDVVSLLVC